MRFERFYFGGYNPTAPSLLQLYRPRNTWLKYANSAISLTRLAGRVIQPKRRTINDKNYQIFENYQL